MVAFNAPETTPSPIPGAGVCGLKSAKGKIVEAHVLQA